METVHIELDIQFEKAREHFGKSAEELKADLTQHIEKWVDQYLKTLETTTSPKEPWLEFLDDIDEYAVDTGIEDFSIFIHKLPNCFVNR